MATIFNKRDYKITINLLGGRSRDLLAKSTANIPDNDLASSHLQTLQGERRYFGDSSQSGQKRKTGKRRKGCK